MASMRGDEGMVTDDIVGKLAGRVDVDIVPLKGQRL